MKGKWVEAGDIYTRPPLTAYRCPHCQYMRFFNKSVEQDWYKFCPMCGADMAIAAWNTRPEPRVLSCEGCEHRGKYEDAVECGYPSPCTGCKRRAQDNYEPTK